MIDAHPTICPKKNGNFVARRGEEYFLYVNDYLVL